MEPTRAEDEAEDSQEEEDLDEVGDEDKATVDVAKPLAGPEERESRAEAAGQRRSRTSTPPSLASPPYQPQGGVLVLFSPASRVSVRALHQRGRLQGHAHQRSVTLLQSQLFIPAH